MSFWTWDDLCHFELCHFICLEICKKNLKITKILKSPKSPSESQSWFIWFITTLMNIGVTRLDWSLVSPVILLESGRGVIWGQKLQNDQISFCLVTGRTGIICQMKISDPITLIKKTQEIQSKKLQFFNNSNSYFRWTFRACICLQNFPKILSNYMVTISWNSYFRRKFQNRKWSHTNGILVRNQSNGFIEHSAKFWRSIFWTITWYVWPSDISVGTSWILCIQGNFSSIFSNIFPGFFRKSFKPTLFTTGDIISSKI